MTVLERKWITHSLWSPTWLNTWCTNSVSGWAEKGLREEMANLELLPRLLPHPPHQDQRPWPQPELHLPVSPTRHHVLRSLSQLLHRGLGILRKVPRVGAAPDDPQHPIQVPHLPGVHDAVWWVAWLVLLVYCLCPAQVPQLPGVHDAVWWVAWLVSLVYCQCPAQVLQLPGVHDAVWWVAWLVSLIYCQCPAQVLQLPGVHDAVWWVAWLVSLVYCQCPAQVPQLPGVHDAVWWVAWLVWLAHIVSVQYKHTI